jgi:mRNA interferase MazF
MTPYKRGDLVLLAFPFTDASGSKLRPAIVVSSDDYNLQSPDFMVASVTGNLNAVPHPGDHVVADWQGAGLLLPSLLQTKIATVEPAMIRRKLGALNAGDLAAFDQGLRVALGLP